MFEEKIIDKFDGEYRFLSNFWMCPVLYDGILYPSSEHAYQAAKTDDIYLKIKISKLPTAYASKKEARKIKLDVEKWDNEKLSIMYRIVKAKFEQNPELREKLIQTGDAILVEGNHWNDTFWGICNLVGTNFLGKILMKVREELK